MSGPMLGEVQVRFAPQEDAPGEHRYRAGPVRISSNQPIEELEPFSVFEPGPHQIEESLEWEREVPTSLVYEGLGWVGGREEAVQCAAGPGLYKLQVGTDREIVLAVDPRGCLLRISAPASDERARHTVLGPGLALALAEFGAFSWHASAAVFGRRLLLFLGPSGAGKSTLARRAALAGGTARVADDVVPVMMDSHLLEAWPCFPQLKLSRSQQWTDPPRLRVAEALVVDRQPTRCSPLRSRLSTREAVLALVGNTVASRLFAPALRARHLDFCVQAAGAIGVSRLRIPDGLDHLDEVVEFLEIEPS